MLATSIIGKPAVNSQDEQIGDVNDSVTDRSGKIIAVLIGVGGFLGSPAKGRCRALRGPQAQPRRER